MHFQLSRASIPEIFGKCDPFDAFPDSSAKYLGQKERKGMKKADDEQTEKDLQCQAKLCGRKNWLKALSSVAIYLADRSAILTNDSLTFFHVLVNFVENTGKWEQEPIQPDLACGTHVVINGCDGESPSHNRSFSSVIGSSRMRLLVA